MKEEVKEQSQSGALLDLIDASVHYYNLYSENQREDTLELHKSIVEKLSVRLQLSLPASALFSYIFFHAMRGYFPTKFEAISIINMERSKVIYAGISELVKSELVKTYKEHFRRPEVKFFIPIEVEEKIMENQVPIPKIRVSRKKAAIAISRIENCEDFIITCYEKTIGTVYFSLLDSFKYTAVIRDEIVTNGDDLDEIVSQLNSMFAEKKIIF